MSIVRLEHLIQPLLENPNFVNISLTDNPNTEYIFDWGRRENAECAGQEGAGTAHAAKKESRNGAGAD